MQFGANSFILNKKVAVQRQVSVCASNPKLSPPAESAAQYPPNTLAGDNIGCLLRGVGRDEITRGVVLAAPDSIKAYNGFEAKFYALSKDDGGRHTPFLRGYCPQFFIRTADCTGEITNFWDEDDESKSGESRQMVLPGDIVYVNVELGKSVAIDVGMKFAVREGKRTVGAGFVTEVFNREKKSKSKKAK